jgi:hypothetical protein
MRAQVAKFNEVGDISPTCAIYCEPFYRDLIWRGFAAPTPAKKGVKPEKSNGQERK